MTFAIAPLRSRYRVSAYLIVKPVKNSSTPAFFTTKVPEPESPEAATEPEA